MTRTTEQVSVPATRKLGRGEGGGVRGGWEGHEVIGWVCMWHVGLSNY